MSVSELPYQGIQILPTHVLLGGWGVQEVLQLLDLALWESNHPCLGVYDPPENLPDALPVSLPGQELLDQNQVLGFPG